MKQDEAVEIKDSKIKKLSFAKRTAIIFVFLLAILLAFNLAPLGVVETSNAFLSLFIHDKREQVSVNNVVEVSDRNGIYTEPTKIVISKIGVDTKILNPISEDIKTLDDALLYGAVRYPGSGDLESKRNIFIFAHSSYLPVVHNQAYKTFNRIQDLKVGDEVKLYSSDAHEYLYKVSEVKLATASTSFVDLTNYDHKLILSTCDSFGKKQDRFVVTANFVSSK